MITVGTMRLPQPEPLDDLGAFLRGLEPDGGYWLTMRRLADHDHSGGLMGVPVSGGGGGTAEVTITGTEGVTVVESPANTFALGLTASPDASNTVEIRANGIYSAAGAIPPEYVTDAELSLALGPYATDTDLANHAAAADPHPTYTTAAELSTAITAHEALANPHAGYLTQAEGDALYRPIAYVTDVTVTTNASLTSTESPANTFALAAQLSPDSGNAIALRANGLYATVPGGSGLPTTGGTMTGSIAVGTTNLYDLGATALRWRKLWATDAETTSTPTVGGVALPTFTTADARYLQSATATTTYVPLAGGSVLTGLLGPTTTNTRDLGTTALRWRKLWGVDADLSGALTVAGNAGVGQAPPAPVAGQAWLRVGPSGLLTGWSPSTLEVADNSYWDGAKSTPLVGGQGASILGQAGGVVTIKTAPAVALAAAQTLTTRFSLAATGTLTLSPAAGAAALAWGTGSLGTSAGSNPRLTSSSSLEFSAASGFCYPSTDNAMTWGGGSNRWTAVYAVAGTINTSSVAYKDPAGDLDPERALAAVLRTPARRFRYKGTERVQAGYYLEEADPLFTIGPGEASPSNDAGVLLAAVQALTARVVALEAAQPTGGIP